MANRAIPTVDELFQLLKKTALPTVLVEGKHDIVFYRHVEEALKDYNVDMLPVGNKDSVLELHRRFSSISTQVPIIYVVDKDLWVHEGFGYEAKPDDVITTDGYSIENDLYLDGQLENLLLNQEKQRFTLDLQKFIEWYALAISRIGRGEACEFRSHPNQVLDNPTFWNDQMSLEANEQYPESLRESLANNYAKLLRGKSLLGLLQRQISAPNRAVKYSNMQLMYLGASRRGDAFERMRHSIQAALDES